MFVHPFWGYKNAENASQFSGQPGIGATGNDVTGRLLLCPLGEPLTECAIKEGCEMGSANKHDLTITSGSTDSFKTTVSKRLAHWNIAVTILALGNSVIS